MSHFCYLKPSYDIKLQAMVSIFIHVTLVFVLKHDMRLRYRLKICMCSIIIRLWDCKINKTWSEVSILRRICQVMRIWIYGLFYSRRFKDKWFVFAKQSFFFSSRSCTKPICKMKFVLNTKLMNRIKRDQLYKLST